MTRTGAHLLCDTLEALGVETVFGLPGTQNVALFEGLRTSAIRTVVASHELGAGFMANGYARASGRVGVVCTIPGPGFTYALTALAEARHDSAPLVLITGAPPESPARRFLFQALDQQGMVAGVVKAAFRADHAGQIPDRVSDAFQAASSGEPGPVLVEVAAAAITGSAGALGAVRRYMPDAQAVVEAAGSVRQRLRAARRPLILAGQGASGGSATLRRLAEALECPVVTTLSGRGALPEDHPLHLALDMGGEAVHVLNEALASADLVLALGCKFTHNGSGGFRLVLLPDRLVHVDASADVAGVNYPASLVAVADVPELLVALAADQWSRSDWTRAEMAGFRVRGAEANGRGRVEPRVHGVSPGTAEALFEAVRGALPRETILVTDSGLHQSLARRHWQVLEARGFIAPSDFQSMGFGIPAGIGAAIANPGRPVVVVTGDGGFNMAGLELLTAVRDRIPLTVVVFNDGQYGLIRLQQMGDYGHTHGVAIANPDYAAFASAIGADYRLIDGDPGPVVAGAVASPRVTLVEVAIGDSVDMTLLRARSAAREALRGAMPAGLVRFLKRRLP